MRPYLQVVVEKVRANWLTRIPKATHQRGRGAVEFRVSRDGQIDDAKYGRSSGKKALDAAAYEAVLASDPLSPLPTGFLCQTIKLRFRFYYNPRIGDVKRHNYDQPVPCVITKIDSVK